MKKKVCWSVIGSDSQKLVDTQKLIAHLNKIPNEQPAGQNTQQIETHFALT